MIAGDTESDFVLVFRDGTELIVSDILQNTVLVMTVADASGQ